MVKKKEFKEFIELFGNMVELDSSVLVTNDETFEPIVYESDLKTIRVENQEYYNQVQRKKEEYLSALNFFKADLKRRIELSNRPIEEYMEFAGSKNRIDKDKIKDDIETVKKVNKKRVLKTKGIKEIIKTNK